MAKIKNPLTVVRKDRQEVEEKDINFYDFDGTLVESWTFAEAADKVALPEQPNHTQDTWHGVDAGLIADGWNWTLEEIKQQKYRTDVGALYKPVYGGSQIFIYLPQDSPSLTVGINTYDQFGFLDWGDGNIDQGIWSGYHDHIHTYEQPGYYAITYENAFSFPSIINGYQRGVFKMAYAGNKLLDDAISLEKVAFSAVASVSYNVDHRHAMPYLKYMTFTRNSPTGGGYMFEMAIGFEHISLPPNLERAWTRICAESRGLKTLTCDRVKTFLNESFRYCNALEKIVIGENCESIGNNSFQEPLSAKELRFCSQIPPVLGGSGAFGYLPSFTPILIPYESVAYLTATNYPSKDTYVYLGYTDLVGALPDSLDGYALTWYETIRDAMSQINPITVGTGAEVYCRYTEV